MIQNLVAWNLENLSAVFFDFDGVIVDSVPIKTKAFQEVFAPYGSKAVEEITRFHLAQGGVSRYEKIKHVLRILKLEPELRLVDELATLFAELVFQKVVSAPYMPGIFEMITGLHEKKIPIFIVSGTPEVEMKEIAKRRDLVSYFREVCGSPVTKSEWLQKLLPKYSLKANRCVFIGDAITDWQAAHDNGVLFLGMGPRFWNS